jgi:sulfate adenylyltransferase subunit 1 (EFTu-like GTPase family)
MARSAPAGVPEYLEQNAGKDLLRFSTVGSVDDGKSTLIGRLLHDTKSIFEDHLHALRTDSARVGTGPSWTSRC